MKGLVKLAQHLDNKDVHVRALDMVDAVARLHVENTDEWEILIVCGIFGVGFREAEPMFALDHVSIHERYDSAIAHLTDYLNGE